ncbi:MAG: hypothetical protein AAGK17_09725, partial [Pseudomonadota bacterium]
VASVEKHLAEFHVEMGEALERTSAALDAGSTNLESFTSAQRNLKTKVVALANTVASITLGEDNYNRHLVLFGRTLGWSHAEALLKNMPN